MKVNRTGKCYFQLKGAQPLAKKAVMARLPVSMDAAVREIAGHDLSDWIRQAIAEKLERDMQAYA